MIVEQNSDSDCVDYIGHVAAGQDQTTSQFCGEYGKNFTTAQPADYLYNEYNIHSDLG